jgi:hypothetical protein
VSPRAAPTRARRAPRRGGDARLELGRVLMDKGVEDRLGRRCGKVDDLVLEVPDPGRSPGRRPELVALVTGPLAFASVVGPRSRRLVRLLYRALGVPDPEPVELPWSAVDQIDVVVHVDADERELGLQRLAEAVGERLIAKLPGGDP